MRRSKGCIDAIASESSRQNGKAGLEARPGAPVSRSSFMGRLESQKQPRECATIEPRRCAPVPWCQRQPENYLARFQRGNFGIIGAISREQFTRRVA